MFTYKNGQIQKPEERKENFNVQSRPNMIERFGGNGGMLGTVLLILVVAVIIYGIVVLVRRKKHPVSSGIVASSSSDSSDANAAGKEANAAFGFRFY